jgi:hypothetical protein
VFEYQKMLTTLLSLLSRLLPASRCRLVCAADGQPYLYRYYLLRGSPDGWQLLLHRFVSSDPSPELHDHPWSWAFSLMLAGQYLEERWRDEGGAGAAELTGRSLPTRQRRVRTGGVSRLRPGDYHRLVLPEGAEAWTLFLHGRRSRAWGFLDPRTRIRRTVEGRTSGRAPAESLSASSSSSRGAA